MSTPTPQPNPNESGSRRRGLLAGVLAGSLGASIMGATLLLGGGSAGAIVPGVTTKRCRWVLGFRSNGSWFCLVPSCPYKAICTEPNTGLSSVVQQP